jgi:rRNA maturation RNase YbeY
MNLRVLQLHRLNSLAKKILGAMGKENASVSVFLMSRRQIADLKRKFGINVAGSQPDVLAFPEPNHFPHPDVKGEFLGEIYINRDIMMRDKDRGIFLLIHGILHLLGYRHNKKTDIIKMESAERKLLKYIISN